MRTAGLVMMLAAGLAAQQPRMQNAKVETRAGSEAAVRQAIAAQTSPGWIGWAAPVTRADRQMCCYSNWNDVHDYGCWIETRMSSADTIRVAPPEAVRLEGNTHFFVLLRVENGVVQKVRTFSQDCPLDAGSLPVVWFTNMDPAASVSFLASLVKPDGASDVRKMSQTAMNAIALHKHPAAERALERWMK